MRRKLCALLGQTSLQKRINKSRYQIARLPGRSSQEAVAPAKMKGQTAAIMYRHGGKSLRQCELFPQGGKPDRKYRRVLKFTEVYSGTRPTYEALLAAGEKVTLLDGQVRSSNTGEEEQRFLTAMEKMSPATKVFFLADCAAALLPPPCVYHSTSGRTVLPWPETSSARGRGRHPLPVARRRRFRARGARAGSTAQGIAATDGRCPR